MNPEDRNKLNDKRLFLIKNIHLKAQLWAALREYGIITEDHEQRIMKECPTNSGRVHKLIDVLTKRGPRAFESFLKALHNSDYEFVAMELDPKMAEKIAIESSYDSPASQISNPDETRDVLLPTALPHPHQLGDVGTLDEELQKIKDKVNSDVPVLNLEVKYGEYSFQDGYKMSHKPRGKVLIISMNMIKGKSERKGGMTDAINVENLFLKMGYYVVTHQDLTAQGMKEMIDKERCEKDLVDFDALVIFAMSHGFCGESSETFIYAADGKKINIKEDITDQFDGNNCWRLKGKPKLFFFQCCRTRKDYVKDAASDAMEEEELLINTHVKADIFTAHSTVCGDRSARFPVYGAWFIRALVCVFSHYCHEKSLLWMMTHVQRILIEMKHIHHKQVAEKSDTMTRQFYFSPIEVPEFLSKIKTIAS